MSEDCLHANIFTNENCLREKNCAVMYYVHGGGFNFDSPMLFPINYVVDNFNTHHRNVIMVTIAYRLGSFGFLNIPQTSAIQNLGLHGA
jgi:carboxylesterase type B